MVKSKELKLMRKKVEKANRLSLDFPLTDGKHNKNNDNNKENNVFWSSNDSQASIELQYWTPEIVAKMKKKNGTATTTTTRLEECLALFEENMGEQYKQSSWGLDLEEKKAELSHSKARFLALLVSNNDDESKKENDSNKQQDLAGFCHYRFDYDDEDSPSEAVLYVYELQIRDQYRRQGLGRKIMTLLEGMAQEYEFSKVMLTVFFSNPKAMDFYTQMMHYSVDETSPSKHGEKADYEILSKKV